MQARKADVVKANVSGVEFLFKKNKITWLKGEGKIAAPGKVEVAGTTYETKNIVIATGSESTPLKGVEVDEKRIVTSTGGLELAEVPKHLVVIGGGVIGLELGSVWRRLGAEVTVIEFLDGLLPGNDGEVRKQFERILTKQGMKIRLKSKVTSAVADASGRDAEGRARRRRRCGGDARRRRAARDRPPAVCCRPRTGGGRRRAGRARPA
jgi:dihydrolipoamide dehydrogenase